MATKLTAKQRAFIDFYFACGMNATQAAKRAGYSPETAYSQGSRLLRNVEIKEEIERLYDEHAPSAAEIIARLAHQSRADMGDLWDEGAGQVDWESARRDGKTNLIHRVHHKTTRITERDGKEIETFEDSIELVNSQTALIQLGKWRKLFVDRTEVTGKDGKPIEVKAYQNFTPDDWDNETTES